MCKKILVPLDGSELAEAVLPQATMLAQDHDAEIILLRVAVYPAFDYAPVDPMFAVAANDVSASIRREAEAYVKQVAERLRASSLKAGWLVADGPVAEAILGCAETTGADLIAMSTHGRSGLARWLIGSVADKVVHAARVPVLLVRPAGNGHA